MRVLKFPKCPQKGLCDCAVRALAGGATVTEIGEGNEWAWMLVYFAPSIEDLLGEKQILADTTSS
jgi:hypothetical protein